MPDGVIGGIDADKALKMIPDEDPIAKEILGNLAEGDDD